MNDDNKVTYFAQTDSRNQKVPFGLKAKDRAKHVYVIGKTGMGKSTLLENMAVQDIQSGEGICFIDPHGKTADLLLEYVPEHRVKDVLYFAPFDLEHPVSFNVLEKVDADKRHLVVSGLMSTFKKIWVDAWSARMEYILGNTLLALLEYPGATLLGVNRMLADKEYRKRVVDNVTDPSVKSFWIDEFGKYTEKFAAEATPAIQNKIGQFTSNALIRNMIGQPESTFDLRKLMDERKILIINLSKGRIGESNANLLGGMLITKIYLAAMSRADLPDRVLKTMPNFYLYVDEFQSFANESFADILSEARKYKLSLTIAHQYIEQMEEEVRAAVFGNVGTMITFRVGAYDAEVLEKEFAPQFTAEDLVNLGFVQIYLKLMIDGISSQPFSANTLPPIKEPAVSYKDKVVDASRAQFSQPRSAVEEAVRKWHEPLQSSAPARGGAGGSGNSGYGGNVNAGQGGSDGRRPSGSGTVSNDVRDRVQKFENRPRPVEPATNSSAAAAAPASAPRPASSAPAAVAAAPMPTPKPAPAAVQQARTPASAAPAMPAPAPAPVSLNVLHKPTTRNNGKVPTEKNVNDLKSALASALKGVELPQGDTKPAPKRDMPKADVPKIEAPKTEPKNTPHEIPEHVLKDILQVDH